MYVVLAFLWYILLIDIAFVAETGIFGKPILVDNWKYIEHEFSLYKNSAVARKLKYLKLMKMFWIYNQICYENFKGIIKTKTNTVVKISAWPHILRKFNSFFI